MIDGNLVKLKIVGTDNFARQIVMGLFDGFTPFRRPWSNISFNSFPGQIQSETILTSQDQRVLSVAIGKIEFIEIKQNFQNSPMVPKYRFIDDLFLRTKNLINKFRQISRLSFVQKNRYK